LARTRSRQPGGRRDVLRSHRRAGEHTKDFLLVGTEDNLAEYEGALVIGERLVADMIDAAKAVLAALRSTPAPKT
jgi:hypothetical protein